MPSAKRRYTAADHAALPESRGTKYEIIWGELFVTPNPIPRHEFVVRRLTRQIEDYLLAAAASALVVNAADVTMSDDTVIEPDILVFPGSELSARWITVRTVLLAVEVLSPSTSRVDRHLKRKRYMDYGVATYWIVDAEHEQVEVWHPGEEFPAVESETLTWRVASNAADLTIDLARLFADLPR